MDSPTTLMRRYGLRAKKSWGQCFLHDPSVLSRIAEAAGVGSDDLVVEIGAGLGSLTAVLAARARHVVAVERDRDLAAVLRQELNDDSRVEVLEENALTLDLSRFPSPVNVVGNLPYNISSPLLFHLLGAAERVSRLTVMLQRELAERLVAEPGTKAYGAPTILVRQVAEARLCFLVPPAAFVPRPQVESAVLRLDPRERPLVEAEDAVLRRLVQSAFQQRRKTLRRALSSAYDRSRVERALAHSAIDGSRRGETLSLEEFGQLARALSDGAGAE